MERWGDRIFPGIFSVRVKDALTCIGSNLSIVPGRDHDSPEYLSPWAGIESIPMILRLNLPIQTASIKISGFTPIHF